MPQATRGQSQGVPARGRQLVLSQEDVGPSASPPRAPSENLQGKSAGKGGEHVQPEASVVQVVGPRRGQVEGERGAAGGGGGVCREDGEGIEDCNRRCAVP